MISKCKKDNLECISKDLICRFQPSIKRPTYTDDKTGEKRLFYNKDCSNFMKVKK